MRTIHLFAGAGGGLLADRILGHEPVLAVELDPYCCRVLRERAAEGWFPGLQVWEGDIRLFNPSEHAGVLAGVDALHAGFPCQDLSVAGKRAGIHGERSGLFFEVVRIVCAIRPRYVFLENVPGVLLFLGTVLGEMAALGYDTRWTCLSAAQVGANHGRNRWWCLAADAELSQWRSDVDQGAGFGEGENREGQTPSRTRIVGKGLADPDSPREQQRAGGECEGWDGSGHGGEVVADASGVGFATLGCQPHGDDAPPFGGWEGEPGRGGAGMEAGNISDLDGSGCCEQRGGVANKPEHAASERCGWWGAEPDVGRVAHGVADRVHRLKALGNGQVPLQAAVAFKMLMEDCYEIR